MTDPRPTPGPVPGGATASTPDAPPAPPSELVRSPLSDGEWHRLHPLTPLLRGGLALLVIIGIVVANMRDRLINLFVPAFAPDVPVDEWEEYEAAGDPIGWVLANELALVAILVVFGAVLLFIGGFYLSWRFHTFRITGDEVEVRSGILFRTQRRAPLDRVQGVNLTRPAIARLLGAAKLEVVGAGTDANVKLEYLSTGNAETIRADILRLASGRRLAEQNGGPVGGGRASLGDTVTRGLTGLVEGDDSDAPEPASVVRIPPGRLIASQIASFGTVMLLAGAVAMIIALANGVFWVLFAYLPALLGFGAYWVRTIVRSLRYSIAPTRDGVRLTFGLLTTVSEVLPPGRIHALEITQPIFWRAFGWWTVRINRLTGRSASDTTTDQFTTVLPVGTLADAERVLGLLQPGLSDELRGAIVRDGLLGPTPGDPYVTTPARAKIIRLLSWKRNGLAFAEGLLLLRKGLIWRRLTVVPLARMQSIAVHQGPIDRMLRIAALRPHTVTGLVYPYIHAIDRDDALAAFERIASLAVSAAASDRSHRWAEGVVEHEPVTFVPPPPYVPPGAPASADGSAAPAAAPRAVPPPPYVPPQPPVAAPAWPAPPTPPPAPPTPPAGGQPPHQPGRP